MNHRFKTTPLLLKNKLCVVLAGSNLNQPIKNILFAKKALLNLSKGNSFRASSLYVSSAWGKTDQADFYNQAFVFKTVLPPKLLMLHLLRIEQQAGRKRFEKWGPRTLDLDLLYVGNQIVDSELLVLPHPEIANRKFCLLPLVEVLPNFIHPVLKQSHIQLLKNCTDKGEVSRV